MKLKCVKLQSQFTIKVGAIVLIKEEYLPRECWKLDKKKTELVYSPDG